MRAVKISVIATIATFFSLIVLNNIQDFETNLQYLQHVLSMDTTLHHSSIMWRAITNPTLQLYCYYAIITWQCLCAALCWLGTVALYIHRRSTTEQFNLAKKPALVGLTFSFLLYMLGFIVIGGEWFCMWQSSNWNAQSTASFFTVFILLSMIVLMINSET